MNVLASSVRFDKGSLWVDLSDGRPIGAPLVWFPRSINTKTPAGRMMMQMVGSFAEFERAMLKERTRAGLDQARMAGRAGDRRPKLNVEQQVQVIKLVESGEKSGADAARLFKVHPSTVTRLMAKHRTDQLSAAP